MASTLLGAGYRRCFSNSMTGSGVLEQEREEGMAASGGKPQLQTNNKSLGTSTFRGFVPDIRTCGVTMGLTQTDQEAPEVGLPESRH